MSTTTENQRRRLGLRRLRKRAQESTVVSVKALQVEKDSWVSFLSYRQALSAFIADAANRRCDELEAEAKAKRKARVENAHG